MAPYNPGHYNVGLQMEFEGQRFGDLVWIDFIVEQSNSVIINDMIDMQ
jgi:hypothetical protein